jgi:IstB-like ATP binding protein
MARLPGCCLALLRARCAAHVQVSPPPRVCAPSQFVAAAMIDCLVHHAEVIALKGDSYRLKDRDLGRVPAATASED